MNSTVAGRLDTTQRSRNGKGTQSLWWRRGATLSSCHSCSGLSGCECSHAHVGDGATGTEDSLRHAPGSCCELLVERVGLVLARVLLKLVLGIVRKVLDGLLFSLIVKIPLLLVLLVLLVCLVQTVG